MMWGDVIAILQAHEWLFALVVVLGAAIVAKLFQSVFVAYMHHLSKKTTTDLDDRILEIASRPIFYLILAAGVYGALLTISTLQPWRRYIDGFFFVLFAIAMAWMGSRIVGLVTMRWFMAKRGLTGTPRLLNILVGVIVYLSAFIIILSHFQIEITPFVAALGLGGLAVGLALQPTLSNIFAGLHIIGDQPIKVGDFIEIEGTISGYVEDIGWRSTRIRTLPNNLVIVPNGKLAESVITNDSLPQQEMSVRVEVGVDYTSDLEKVEKVTVDVAKKIQKNVEGAKRDHEPFIRYHTFADSNINFSVILRAVEPVAQYQIKHEFIKALHKAYLKNNIEISWPITKHYFMDPLQIKKPRK